MKKLLFALITILALAALAQVEFERQTKEVVRQRIKTGVRFEFDNRTGAFVGMAVQTAIVRSEAGVVVDSQPGPMHFFTYQQITNNIAGFDLFLSRLNTAINSRMTNSQ